MTTFGERLKAAMLAAAVESPEHLARRCGRNRREVMEWIASDGRSMSAEDFVVLCETLGVRSRWLWRGTGGMRTVDQERANGELEAVELFHSIPQSKVRFWFGMGRRLAKR